MSFRPVIPASGLIGWRFLQRTYSTQLQSFSSAAKPRRDAAYFLDRIGNVRTADDLVSDRQLLQVALGAYGLQDDLQNRAFIRKVLADGSSSRDALANRLTDARYRAFSAAFGLGPGEAPATSNSDKMRAVVNLWNTSSFETAVGDQDDQMQIALYAQRTLGSIADRNLSENAKWFTLMGQAPLRSMFETALGLPTSFGKIDIDQQLRVLREKIHAATGTDSFSQFSNEEGRERLVTLYLTRSQMSASLTDSSPASTALFLLQ